MQNTQTVKLNYPTLLRLPSGACSGDYDKIFVQVSHNYVQAVLCVYPKFWSNIKLSVYRNLPGKPQVRAGNSKAQILAFTGGDCSWDGGITISNFIRKP